MSDSELGLLGRIWRFGAVGIAATAVHSVIGLTLHYGFGMAAFWANAIAFSCALFVSFFGQTRLTFPESTADRSAFLRFAIVALTGLGLNQLLVWLVVGVAGGPYWLALIAIYATVPGLTFLALRHWALRE